MKREIPDDLFTTYSREIKETFRRAVRHALWRHKRLGRSIGPRAMAG